MHHKRPGLGLVALATALVAAVFVPAVAGGAPVARRRARRRTNQRTAKDLPTDHGAAHHGSPTATNDPKWKHPGNDRRSTDVPGTSPPASL